MNFAQEFTDDMVKSQSRLHQLSADQTNALTQATRSIVNGYTAKLYNIKRDSLAATFSARELNQIDSFYNSEIGKKLVQEELDVSGGLREVQHSSINTVRQEILTAASGIAGAATSMRAQPEIRRQAR